MAPKNTKTMRERNPDGTWKSDRITEDLDKKLFNEVIDVKKELQKLHRLNMRYIRGSLKLSTEQARTLRDMYRILSDKLIPDAPRQINSSVMGDAKIVIGKNKDIA